MAHFKNLSYHSESSEEEIDGSPTSKRAKLFIDYKLVHTFPDLPTAKGLVKGLKQYYHRITRTSRACTKIFYYCKSKGCPKRIYLMPKGKLHTSQL